MMKSPRCVGLAFLGILFPLMWGASLQAAQNRIVRPLTEKQVAKQMKLTVDQVHKLTTMRGLTLDEIPTLPPAKLARALARISEPKPDHPGEAIRYHRSFHVDEAGMIADGAEVNAQLQAQKVVAGEDCSVWGGNEQVRSLRAGGIYPIRWTWLGPGNIGGRSRSTLIHPTNTNTMWFGSVSGGIWKTTNGGTAWTPIANFMPNIAICCMAMDPTNPDLMYAGTGEGFSNWDNVRGAGIFKTTDGGNNWAQLTSTANADFYYVNRLSFNTTGTVPLAATSTGVMRSTDGGASWAKTWTTRALDVKFDPNNASKAVAGGATGGAYSTDGGATWTASTGLATSGRVELAYAKAQTNTIYASQDTSSGSIYKSTNGGSSYTQISTPAHLGAQGWYDNVIWVDPVNSYIFIGGIDLYRSSNGGTSFSKISSWSSAPYSAHADHHGIFPHPGFNGTTNKTVYFCNDGGIYKATDAYTVAGTSGWTELNNNLGVTQFYGGAANAAGTTMVGGTQDNGTLCYTSAGGTEAWSSMYGGDGGYCAYDWNDTNYCYGEYVYLQIHRSTNGGSSSSSIYSGITDASNQTAEFIAPFILDPNNSIRLLGGGRSLWRTNNAKATSVSWSSIKAADGTSNITAIAVAKGNSDIIWVGHANGDVFKTINGTATTPTWTQTDGTTLPARRVTRFAIDPTNTNNVFVSFSGFSGNNLYRTTDGGTTWTDVTGSGVTGLPDAPIYCLTMHPSHPEWIYVGSEVGIFASEDSGATWSRSNDGPTYSSVWELIWNGTSDLIAVTHGRGFYKTRITRPAVAADLVTLANYLGGITNTIDTAFFDIDLNGTVDTIDLVWLQAMVGGVTPS